ncbi:uroporphyrinogen-III C-methyltransferase [Parapedobacter tibetensis]|uniref:uroporphyrinogen-III C-methyltransferase n=1 Tax=Parapedobacter tibetensis TaxID=2972951 RepID=UPI00214D9A75|nr:uroporphyrinogen-III C-methyltransferase [Parapedobacter tibetensis]
MTHEPKLTLLGAGPGDPDLMTLKGVNALNTADVVLYDTLANEALLAHAPAKALKLFVGKRSGKHCVPQEEINQLIVHYAYTHGHVVRLKGGDPYVFGRGHEELAYADRHGIPVAYIPGISSAVSVPGLNGIPLTKRGVNESFWVVTGTLTDGSIAKDLYLAAQSSATVVILMGVKKLPEIVAIFKKYRGTDECIAVIQNGSKDTERRIFGEMGNILNIQEEAQIGAPAIIVIGKVAGEPLGSDNYRFRPHQVFCADIENPFPPE